VGAPRRGRGRRILLVSAQVLLALLVLEVGLRLARGHFKGLDRLLYLPDVSTAYDEIGTLEELLDESMLGYRPFKGSSGFVLNSRGLRTPEYEIEKRPGTWRLVVLGDSFAYASGGMPYGLHWPYLTGRGLEERISRPVEVVNLGAPGIGPAFYYRMWQLEGSRLGADRVVVSLYVGNDLTDEWEGAGNDLGEEDAIRRLARWSLGVRAARALYLLRGLEDSPQDNALEAESAAATPHESGPGPETPRGGYEVMRYRERFDPMSPSMRPHAYLEKTADRMKICLKRNAAPLGRRVERIFPFLEAIRDQVGAGGGGFTVMLVPDEFQVSEPLREAVYRHLGTEAAQYDLRLPQERILARCEASAMDCLDLLPAFERGSGEAVLYKPRDTHWNLEGNALAARLLAEHLAEASRGDAGEGAGAHRGYTAGR
jgi:hypothetical protein